VQVICGVVSLTLSDYAVAVIDDTNLINRTFARVMLQVVGYCVSVHLQYTDVYADG